MYARNGDNNEVWLAIVEEGELWKKIVAGSIIIRALGIE